MAIVKKYPAEVVQVENIVEGIYTLELRSLCGQFKYYPGQFLHLALDEYDPAQAWPESRCYSMQSSPRQENIKITYAVKGRYTQRMAETLKPGSQVWLKLPYGNLFQQNHSLVNTVFIAGGTGITPFLSLFTDPGFSQYDHPVCYFGARNESYHIYKEALAEAQRINAGFQVYTVYQEEQGMLDIDKILRECGTGSTYFISGPPVMITIFKKHLEANEVSLDNIRTDEWE